MLSRVVPCKRRRRRQQAPPRVVVAHVPMPMSRLPAQGDAAKGLNAEEEKYMKSLSSAEASRIRKEEERLMQQTTPVPLRFRVLQSNLSTAVKLTVMRRLAVGMDTKTEAWVQRALLLPIGAYKTPPTDHTSETMQNVLRHAKQHMDVEICGNDEAKYEILRILGQWLTSGDTSSCVIGFEGPPGVGKTTFARAALAESLHRPFCFIGLGGASDASFLCGHSYTYEGSTPGRVADELSQAGCMDPVLYFDELDKIAKTSRGDEVVNALIHLTDPSQNVEFRDKYFQGMSLDLSRAVIVFSFNNRDDISPILLDRIKVIRCESPSVAKKKEIACKHLLPRAIRAIGSRDLVEFSDCAFESLIRMTSESGVRQLGRFIRHIVNTLNVAVHGGADIIGVDPGLVRTTPIRCTEETCRKLIVAHEATKAPPLTMYS